MRLRQISLYVTPECEISWGLQLTLFQFLGILLREDAELLLEAFREIFRRVETYLGGYIANQNVRVRLHDAASLLHPDCRDEGDDRLPRGGFHLII